MFSSCASSPLPAPPLVFDLGVHTFRAGTSGDVLPRWIAPSVVGYAHDDVASSFFSSSPSFFSPTSYRGDAARRREARGMLLAPLNPLEKRDHLDVYPVVSCSLHPHRSFNQTTQIPHHLKSEGEDERGRAVVRMKEEDDPRVRTKAGRRDGGSSAMTQTCRYIPSGCGGVYYEVDIPGFTKLIEVACGPRGLNEGSLEGRAVLLTEPNYMNRKLRDAYAEMLFEDLKVSHGFLCKKAALACFGCARTSSIVVDIGHSNTSVCAVQEGYVLQRSVQEVLFGSYHLSSYARSVLLDPVHNNNITSITPGYAVTRFPSHSSDDTFRGTVPSHLSQQTKGETDDLHESTMYEHSDHPNPITSQWKVEEGGGCNGATSSGSSTSPGWNRHNTQRSSPDSKSHEGSRDLVGGGRGLEASGGRAGSPSSSLSSTAGGSPSLRPPGTGGDGGGENRSHKNGDRHRKGGEGESNGSNDLSGVKAEHIHNSFTKQEEGENHSSQHQHLSVSGGLLPSPSSPDGREEDRDVKTKPSNDSHCTGTRISSSSIPRTFTDWRHNEVVEVIACPHVTPSYREWGEAHILETLTQVLGECRSRRSALALEAALLLPSSSCSSPSSHGILHEGRVSSPSAEGRGGGRCFYDDGATGGAGEVLGHRKRSHASPLSSSRRRDGGEVSSLPEGSTLSHSSSTSSWSRHTTPNLNGGHRSQDEGADGCGGKVGHGHGDNGNIYMLPDGTMLNSATVERLREGIPEMLFSSTLRARLFPVSPPPPTSPLHRQSRGVFFNFPGVGRGEREGRLSVKKQHEREGSACGGGAPSSDDNVVDGSRSRHNSRGWGVSGGGHDGSRSGTSDNSMMGADGVMDCMKTCILECARSAGDGAGQLRGRDIVATVVPTGGGTLFPGFLSRFKEEIQALQADQVIGGVLGHRGDGYNMSVGGGVEETSSPPSCFSSDFVAPPLRVVASSVDAERHFAAWIGGSILSCLGSFPQFCVTKEEYEEFGARGAIDRKCP
ncbi:actin-like protein alp3b [Cystoisospora suis]|uniref:Actin-like protein alp3b n=1 Tax=Cystoisospora suis TaxID=483139 RepID=A0A2C6KEU2_9APIC|nr:actin-like protein alp3b [Cystoisospora suis]